MYLIPAYELVGTLTPAGMGIGKVTFPTKGLIRGSKCLLYGKIPKILNVFYYSIFSSTSYFLDMITLIILVGTLTHSTMEGR